MGFPPIEGEFRRYQDTLINMYAEVALFAATDGLIGLGLEAFSAWRLGQVADVARDAAGIAYGRRYATYVGGYKDGKVVVGRSSNPEGCAEDDVARLLGSDADMTKAFGWRKNKITDKIEWTELPVCMRCQSKYQSFQFPRDVKAEPGGPWAEVVPNFVR
jgi:hypothetical protein